MRTVLFAGGGTAGHIEPALAVARVWRERHPQDRILFVGTDYGLEKHLVPAANFELRTIPRVVLPRRINLNLIKAPLAFVQALLQARKVVKGVDIIIGFGGYVCAPIYVAGRKKRLVIHEANARPGWANRLGARFTSYLAVAQPVMTGAFADALITGIPLRSDVQSTLDHTTDWAIARKSAKRELGFPEDEPLVIVMGGSQGSISINATISQALGAFEARSINVMHSVGAQNELPEHRYHYRPVHYINEMARSLLAADLVIARSGAITCSEVNALGRYALFIPLPIGNGEQEVNAQALVEEGRAEVLEQGLFTSQWIAGNIDRLMSRSASRPLEGSYADHDAAEKIANFMEHAWQS